MSISKKQFATLCAVILSLFWGSFDVFATVYPFFEDFNSYSIGSLNGQGGWSGSPYFQITDSTNCLEGKCVNSSELAHSIFRPADATSTLAGSVIFYIRSNQYDGVSSIQGQTPVGVSKLFEVEIFETYMNLHQDSGDVNFCSEYSLNTWHKIEVEWQANQSNIRARCNDGNFTEWKVPNNQNPMLNLGLTNWRGANQFFDYVNNVGYTPTSTIEITSPTPGTTTTIPFILNATYNKASTIADYIQIFFIRMATTSCPAYLSADWWDNALDFSGSGYSSKLNLESGTTTIYFDSTKLTNQGGSNWCAVCQFLNYASSTISADKCNGYTLNFSTSTIEIFIPPTYPSFTQYYLENSFGEWATSTALFTSFSNGIEKISNKLVPYASRIMSVLSEGNAQSLGQQFGSSIPTIRGYLLIIDSFFNNFPISTFLLFAIVIYFAVFLWNFLARLLEIFKAIRPF